MGLDFRGSKGPAVKPLVYEAAVEGGGAAERGGREDEARIWEVSLKGLDIGRFCGRGEGAGGGDGVMEQGLSEFFGAGAAAVEDD